MWTSDFNVGLPKGKDDFTILADSGHHTDNGMALQAQHCPTLGKHEGRETLYTLGMIVILQAVRYAFVRTAAAKWLPPA